MSIRIERNEAGNCINFYGSSNPTYWNACLSGEVDSEYTDTINVINDIITAQTGVTKYEFFRIPYTNFSDKDNNSFASAQEAADYITANANVIGLSGEGIDLIGQDLCFHLDATSTSIVLSNGEHYGVNTIKAVPENGNVSIISVDTNETIKHYYNLEVGRACVDDAIIPGGLNDVVDVLNELFTVGAFESVVITDPEATVIADVQGVDDSGGAVGNNAIDPVGADILGTTATHNNAAGYLSNGVIDQAGEYFTFDIAGKASYGFGLVHTQSSYDDGYYNGNASYADPAGFCVGANSSHLGYQFSHHFHIGNAHASWTNYGANTSYVMGEAWYDHNNRFDLKDEWNNGDPVKVKVGINELGFITISTLANDGINWRLHARSAYPVPQGSSFRLGIKLQTTGARLRTQPKIHELAVDVSPPTTLGDQSITVFEDNAGDINGTLVGGITSDVSVTNSNDGFVSTETISAIGDYFQFGWSAGDANVGLFSHQDHNVADLQADRTAWGNNDYIYFGARTENNLTMNNIYYENGSHTFLAPSGGAGYGRVGFDAQGRATLWYSSDGTTWTAYRRHNQSAPNGTYSFIWIAQEGDAANLDSLTKGTMSFAPTMNFRYAESPDGVFRSPLFATAEEAEYYDTVKGGSGTYTTLMLPDDPTNTLWHAPDTEYTGNGIAAPVGVTFEGVLVNYTEITTLTNADLLPPAFTAATVTVNELSSFNYQTQPQDTGYGTSFLNLPVGLVDVGGGMIGGTAPEVTGDNVTNPTDSYDITVVRTNSEGSSTGTLTIVVTNLTAPVITAITGFTHNASSTALVDPDTMDSGSVVDMDESLLDLERLVILKSFVETNVLPSLQQAGDKYYMGVLNSGADISSVEDSDWDVAFVWEYQTSTTHQYRVIKDGVQQHQVGIGSRTVALFDYAIEAHDGQMHMIACNQNAINTEPSPEFGGVFTNATEVALGELYPLTISLAYVGSTSANFSETNLSEIVTPSPDDWIQVTGNPSHVLNFDGSTSMPTLQAGYTYRFLMGDTQYADLSTSTGLHVDDDLRFTADGSTEYTTGITRVGNPNDTDTFGAHTAYVEFVVPADVPPLQWYTDHNGIGSATGLSISGSTYVVTVTGITQEGPAVNQTGTNLFDQGNHGWISVNETLAAGERLILDGTFLADLVGAMPDNSDMRIGIKDGSWTDAYDAVGFEGLTYIYIARYNSSTVQLRLFGGGNYSSVWSTSATAMSTFSFFLEITNSGNNIRVGMTQSPSFTEDVNSTTYADWSAARKQQSGDGGYGITSRDIMFLGSGALAGNLAGMDSADVDWTGLSEINVPSAGVSNLTSWSKALDFSGSSERAAQVTQDSNRIPMKMNGQASLITGTPTSGYTSSNTSARPWATAVVFKIDGNSSNQHIWNLGEGAGDNDDNIYLRVDANQNLYFGWGRNGALNECRIATAISSAFWYAVYIGHDGRRWASAGATAGNLYQTFDIRMMSSHDNFASSWDAGTYNDWNQASSTTGGRMDRGFTGEMTIGGRGANRNFHGKVASFVTTTLRRGVAMPTDTEIELMITDPTKWLQDYKVGNAFRLPWQANDAGFNFSLNDGSSAYSCQVWLMGDGTNDSYSNMIRNQVLPSDQNYTKLNLISMVSNDIENVTITGLS